MTTHTQSGLRARPALAQEIGMIAVEWAHLEYQRCFLLEAITGIQYAAAQAVFETVTGNKVKRDIICNCARAVQLSTKAVAEIDGLMLRAKKLARRRNDLVHKNWQAWFEKHDMMARWNTPAELKTHKSALRVTSIKELRKLVPEIVVLSREIMTYGLTLKQRTPSRRKSRAPSEPRPATP